MSQVAPANDNYQAAIELIAQAQTIAISGHTNPDGDALGSGLALMHAINIAYPEKVVDVLLADDAPVPRIYRFLPGAERYVYASGYDKAPDLFISVDTPKVERLRHSQAVFERARHTLGFDHHPDMEAFADVCIKRPSSAAVGCIMAHLAQALQIEVTPEFATCVLTGVVTDTGRFQYQNADREAFAVASRMVDAGADPARISLEVYQSESVNYLHLKALVSSRIQTFANGLIAYSYVTQEDFDSTGATKDESDGLIDIVRSVRDSQICLLLRENSKVGNVRGNLRSKSTQDIGAIARQFGGGGHKAAAGFTVDGTLKEAFDQVMPVLIDLAQQH